MRSDRLFFFRVARFVVVRVTVMVGIMNVVRVAEPMTVKMRSRIVFPLLLCRARGMRMRHRRQLAGEKPDDDKERNTTLEHEYRLTFLL